MKKSSYVSLFILAMLLISESISAACLSDVRSKVFKASNIFGNDSSAILYERNGSGMITNIQLIGAVGSDISMSNHVWVGFYRTTMNVYVDNELSVNGTIYELCGLGSKSNNYDDFTEQNFSTPLFSKLGLLSGIQFTFKIPYYKSIKIELVRHPDDVGQIGLMWGLIRDCDEINIDYGTIHIPRGAKFKGLKVNKVLAPGQEITIFNTQKKGVLLGCCFDCVGETFGWVEGCVRAYLKGSTTPVMISSGFEDYLGFCFAFNLGTIQFENFGATYVHMKSAPFHVTAYRQHFNDPIYFKKGGFKLTGRNNDQDCNGIMSTKSTNGLVGTRGNCDYTAIAYYYEW